MLQHLIFFFKKFGVGAVESRPFYRPGFSECHADELIHSHECGGDTLVHSHECGADEQRHGNFEQYQ